MTHSTNTVDAPADVRPVAGYVRVSTKAQEVERQEASIPARHSSLPDGLASNALELFDDKGLSAYSGRTRPGYEAMVERIARGEFSALIVDTSSRLTRQGIEEALPFMFALKRVSTRLFTTEGREYTFDMPGYMQMVMDAAGDERYSATLSHNISSGKATAARAGRWHHGVLPPGYRYEKPDLHATGDLPLMRSAMERFLDGQTIARVCAFLEADLSAEYFAGTRSKVRRVRPDHLRRWLSNPLYAGMIRRRDELHQGHHKEAVSRETFERVQRRLAQNAAQFVKPARSWPFSGVAKCASCGNGMRLHPVRNRHGQHFFYVRCNGERTCPGRTRSIIASSFEANIALTLAAVARATGDLLAFDPEWGVTDQDGALTLDAAREALTEAEERLTELAELVKARAIKTSDPAFREATAARDDAEATFEAVARQRSSYREELAELTARIEALTMNRPLHAERMREDDAIVTHAATGRIVSDHGIEDVLQGWLAADFETKREVILATLDKALVGHDSAELHFRLGLPGPILQRLTVESRRGDDLRALESLGFGAVVDGVGRVSRPL